MTSGSASRPLVPQLRRVVDLSDAAALGAALVHVGIAVARGWPRAPWIDSATSSVVLGEFCLLLVLYSARWLYPDAKLAGRRSRSGASRRAHLAPVVRASGESVVTALLVGAVVALLGTRSGSDAAVRAYYGVLLVFAAVRAIVARRRS